LGGRGGGKKKEKAGSPTCCPSCPVMLAIYIKRKGKKRGGKSKDTGKKRGRKKNENEKAPRGSYPWHCLDNAVQLDKKKKGGKRGKRGKGYG